MRGLLFGKVRCRDVVTVVVSVGTVSATRFIGLAPRRRRMARCAGSRDGILVRPVMVVMARGWPHNHAEAIVDRLSDVAQVVLHPALDGLVYAVQQPLKVLVHALHDALFRPSGVLGQLRRQQVLDVVPQRLVGKRHHDVLVVVVGFRVRGRQPGGICVTRGGRMPGAHNRGIGFG